MLIKESINGVEVDFVSTYYNGLSPSNQFNFFKSEYINIKQQMKWIKIRGALFIKMCN